MTPTNLLYWLAGALDMGGVELLERAGASGTDEIRKHATLALNNTPNDSLALSVYALADKPSALESVVRAHLLNVTKNMQLTDVLKPPKINMDELLRVSRELRDKDPSPVRSC